MTERNYRYRTDPLFLRNQFETAGKYGIPMIPKPELSINELDGIRFIGFDKAKADQGRHGSRIVHFFLYDYAFQQIWNRPEQSIDMLRRYKAVLTPDFSVYTEMPVALQLYNTFRNRWCGAYFAAQGLRVIPTVNFGLEGSFDFAFEGIAPGSAVAVSTYMVQSKEGREAQKEFFLAGYNEPLRRVEPEVVLCYHEPFPEMQGNVIPIDYDLSSWRHMDDDVAEPEKEGNHDPSVKGFSIWKTGYALRDDDIFPQERDERPSNEPYKVVKYGGYVVQLGSGSAYGGKWKPRKPEDERFFGAPGKLYIRYDKRGRRYDTKMDENGRAFQERHYTDHGYPKYHSNPHDHILKYKPDGSPDWQNSEQINYFDGNVPEFKQFKEGDVMCDNREYTYENLKKQGCLEPEFSEYYKFHSIAEFQRMMRNHVEVVFVYNKKVYSLTYIPGKIVFGEAYYEGDDDLFDTSEEVLNQVLDGKKLRDIITEIQVVERYLF